jgi:hypothetical protein
MNKTIVFQSLEQPFLLDNRERKWPDGLASSSVSQRRKTTTVITGNPARRPSVLVFFPGRQNWLYAVDDNDNIVAHHNDSKDKIFTVDMQSHQFLDPVTSELITEQVVLSPQRRAPIHWRPVAYGMTLSTNVKNGVGTGKNGGWFAAARFSTPEMEFDTIVSNNTDDTGNYPPSEANALTTNVYNRYLIQTGDVTPHQKVPSFLRLNNSPSFMVGELSHLNNAIFKLNNTSGRNEFIENRQEVFSAPKYFTFQNFWVKVYYGPISQKYSVNFQPGMGIYRPIPPFALPPDAYHDRKYVERKVSRNFDTIVLYLFCDEEVQVNVSCSVHREFLYLDSLDPSDPTNRPMYYSKGWYIPKDDLGEYIKYSCYVNKLPATFTKQKSIRITDPYSVAFS